MHCLSSVKQVTYTNMISNVGHLSVLQKFSKEFSAFFHTVLKQFAWFWNKVEAS